VSLNDTGAGHANVDVSRMKNSLPGTPCSAGPTPVIAVTHAGIVVLGIADTIVSLKYASLPSRASKLGSSWFLIIW
jgi:hypothetical protein